MITFLTTATTVTTTSIASTVAALSCATLLYRRSSRVQPKRSERGEGVISTAIAVLIMTILGGIMFFAYQRTFNKSTAKVDRMVDELDQVDAKTASQNNG